MTKLSYLTKTEKKAIEEFKRKITQRLAGELLELKLFGSKARGDFKKTSDIGEMSDIDIFIVLKKTSLKKEDFIFKIATDILLKYTVDIEPKIFSEKEYKERINLQLPFFLIIEKEGVLL